MRKIIYIIAFILLIFSCASTGDTKLVNKSLITNKKEFVSELNSLLNQFNITSTKNIPFSYTTGNFGKLESDLNRYISLAKNSISRSSSSLEIIAAYDKLYSTHRFLELLYRSNNTFINLQTRESINIAIIEVLQSGLNSEISSIRSAIEAKHGIKLVGNLSDRLVDLLDESKDKVVINSVSTIQDYDFSVVEVYKNGYILKVNEDFGSTQVYLETDREYSEGSVLMGFLNVLNIESVDEYLSFKTIDIDYKSYLVPGFTDYKHSIILRNYVKNAYYELNKPPTK